MLAPWWDAGRELLCLRNAQDCRRAGVASPKEGRGERIDDRSGPDLLSFAAEKERKEFPGNKRTRVEVRIDDSKKGKAIQNPPRGERQEDSPKKIAPKAVIEIGDSESQEGRCEGWRENFHKLCWRKGVLA